MVNALEKVDLLDYARCSDHMEALAKLISAIATIAWPLAFVYALIRFSTPFKRLIESAHERKFTIKVAGNELTMEEVSEQTQRIISDLQSKVAALEKAAELGGAAPIMESKANNESEKRILWVDDQPRNNSLIVAALESRGVRVDTALSTDEGLRKFEATPYDAVISDLGRPEGGKAGFDLTRQIRKRNADVPIFIFSTASVARALKEQAQEAGVTGLTSSSSTLLSMLPI